MCPSLALSMVYRAATEFARAKVCPKTVGIKILATSTPAENLVDEVEAERSIVTVFPADEPAYCVTMRESWAVWMRPVAPVAVMGMV
jgi:hypothetical protein